MGSIGMIQLYYMGPTQRWQYRTAWHQSGALQGRPERDGASCAYGQLNLAVTTKAPGKKPAARLAAGCLLLALTFSLSPFPAEPLERECAAQGDAAAHLQPERHGMVVQ